MWLPRMNRHNCFVPSRFIAELLDKKVRLLNISSTTLQRWIKKIICWGEKNIDFKILTDSTCFCWFWQYPLVKPVVTPRFAPTCTGALLGQLGAIAKNNNLHIQVSSLWQPNQAMSTGDCCHRDRLALALWGFFEQWNNYTNMQFSRGEKSDREETGLAEQHLSQVISFHNSFDLPHDTSGSIYSGGLTLKWAGYMCL